MSNVLKSIESENYGGSQVMARLLGALCAGILVFTTTAANATLNVVSGTGQIGDGVTLMVISDTFQGGSYGFTNGGKIHSPSGDPDLFFRAASTPTFPGALDNYVEWYLGFKGDFGIPSEGAVDGSDNWMKVIRDGDGSVSWAQLVFDFSGLGGDNAPTLIDIPLYVTQSNGADFTLAQAVQAVTAPVPEAETYAMMLAGLGLVGFMVRRKQQSA